jgi:hypothetical protein
VVGERKIDLLFSGGKTLRLPSVTGASPHTLILVAVSWCSLKARVTSLINRHAQEDWFMLDFWA